jgi:hypothetical protein
MSPHDAPQMWDRPIGFHVDAQFFNDDRLGINFWTPLVACGVEAPGMVVIPMSVADSRKYLEHDRSGHDAVEGDIALMHHFRCCKMASDVMTANRLSERSWAPEFALGDVLAFTNFTIHATHCTPAMTQPRSSLEIRVDLPGYALDA